MWAVASRSWEHIDHSVTALYESCSLRQLNQQGRELFSHGAAAAVKQPGHEVLVARLQLALGTFCFYLGLTEESLELFRKSEPRLRQAKLRHEQGLNLMWTGHTMSNTGFSGRLSEGKALLEQGFDIFEENGDAYYQARCLGNLGNNLLRQGDYEQASQIMQESLVLFDTLGIEWGQAAALITLGKLGLRLDKRPGDSRRLLEKGLTLARRLDRPSFVSVALEGLAFEAEEEGDLRTAVDFIHEALDYSRASGLRGPIPDQLNMLGQFTYKLGQTDRAIDYFQRSLELIRQFGYRALLGGVLTNLGMLERDKGKYGPAGRYFNEALAIGYELEQVGEVLRTLSEVARMERKRAVPSQFLPELLAFLNAHPLSLPAIRDGMLAIADALDLDLSPKMLAEAPIRPLSDIVDMVRNEMLA